MANMLSPTKSFPLPKLHQSPHTSNLMPPSQFRQSDVHWYDAETVVVRALKSDMAVKVHVTMLVQHSEVLRDMFLLPRPSTKPDSLLLQDSNNGEMETDDTSLVSLSAGPVQTEGTASNPIELPVTIEELEDVVGWFYRQWDEGALATDRKLREQKNVNLLKISRMWIMDIAANSAIKELQQLYLPAARRIELARLYNIENWLKPAFQVLLSFQLTELGPEQVSQIGFGLYEILARGKERLELYRRSLAFVPPELSFAGDNDSSDDGWGGCERHQQCISAWKSYWWRHMARDLLHPDSPLSFDDISETISKAAIQGLADNCKAAVLRKLNIDGPQRVLDRVVSLACTHIASLG